MPRTARALAAAAVLSALAFPAAAHATPFLYVGTNAGVSPFDAPVGGALAALTAPAGHGQESYLAATPNGNTLYTTGAADTVNEYAVATDGTLTYLGAATGLAASQQAVNRLAVSADGRSLYASVGGGSNIIEHFRIDPATGLLTAQSTTAAPAPGYLTVSPNAGYVVVSVGTGLAVYARDLTTGSTAGNLTPVTQTVAPNSGGGGATAGVVFSPDGTHVYAVNLNTQTVYAFTFAAGQLTADVPASAPTTRARPIDLAVAPDGKDLYVSELSASDSQLNAGLDQYHLGAGGTLPAASTSNVQTSGGAYSVAISPDGTHVADTLVTTSQVRQFSRDAGSGALSAPVTLATRGADNGLLYVTPDAVTAVGFHAGTVRALRHGVRVSWKAGAATNVLGYDVLRQQGHRRVRVNRTLIKGRALGVRSARFSFVDPHGRLTSRYVVVERHTDKTKTTHAVGSLEAAR